MRQIRRDQIHRSLAMAAVIALLMSGCGSPTNTPTPVPSISPSPQAAVTDQNANEKVKAIFYENAQQCKTDTQKQQEEYTVLLKAFQAGTLATKPTAPGIKTEDCEAQIFAAKQEHERNAPVYSSLTNCQADGVQCESTVGSSAPGYRPIFGGSYFYPYGGSNFVYLDYGGSRHRVYRPRTVYRSSQPGQVVTPFGRVVSKTQPGRVTVPRHTTVAAPPRPTGTAGRGTIKGRSSTGFGSTFKSTGRGGK